MHTLTIPVMLILTGAIFLLDYNDGYSVRQTWPVLVIWVGLNKLLAYLLSRPQPSGGT